MPMALGENTINGNGFGIYCYQSHGGSTHPAGDIFANNSPETCSTESTLTKPIWK